MKKMMIALVAMLAMAATGKAMSYEQARNEALFLTDKMAYELNLTDEQYEAAYEINLDYLMGVTSYDDVYGNYWERRNLDMSYILLDWQWRTFCAATRREGVGIVAKRVVLVVVGDGIAEIHRVSGVGYQRVLQLYHYLLSRSLNLRHLQLRGRHDDVLRGVCQLDELVEVDGHLLRIHVGSLFGRNTVKHAGRVVVIPAAIGLSHTGTARNEE